MVILFIVGSLTIYLGVSLVLLNGELTYWTSFNESTIQDSKNKNLFVTDKMQIEARGDSMQNWNTKFDIWTNKRYEIKYWGIAFYWTFENPNWRYLNINPKKDYIEHKYFRKRIKINDFERDYMKNFTGGYEPCCNRIACEVGDTITLEFMESKENIFLGEIKTIVK
jgi:hypothetical protein